LRGAWGGLVSAIRSLGFLRARIKDQLTILVSLKKIVKPSSLKYLAEKEET